MSESEQANLTHHALLVAWGLYAQAIGLVEGLEAVELDQKTISHRPQTKLIEFLVAILGGLEHLKDISLSAHPLDQDAEVARAWGQAAWADHSGVSRTLHSLTQTQVQQVIEVLHRVSQPFIDKEVMLALGSGRLHLDGDLSPRPVSDTATTYPGADFGLMSDHLGQGYQAEVVSLRSPTYGRLGLSVAHRSGSTVSNTQAEALVVAAEQRIGRRPMRRTDLLAQRIAGLGSQRTDLDQKVAHAQQQLTDAQAELAAVQQAHAAAEQVVESMQEAYAQLKRLEQPHSRLAQAKQHRDVYARRQLRRLATVEQAQRRLDRQQAHRTALEAHLAGLGQRLAQFEADNATNLAPIDAMFRLDAGFGTADNVALLIEMGYEVYTKPFGNWLLSRLKAKAADRTDWQRVGKNAEMIAWAEVVLDDFPYPLDLALERFWTGGSEPQLAGLLHFGRDKVTTDLTGWFGSYNARQTIEALNREGKQVFEVHHLKVRAGAALLLQEHFTLFAANFVRFASVWLAEHCPHLPDGWQDSTQPQVKQQVKVAAQTSAYVSWYGQNCLLRFTDHSVFASRSLNVVRVWAFQPVLPMAKSCVFSPI